MIDLKVRKGKLILLIRRKILLFLRHFLLDCLHLIIFYAI
jgi:hypothetical protein